MSIGRPVGEERGDDVGDQAGIADGDVETVCYQSGGTAWYCELHSEPIATTRDLTFVDPNAPPYATYRIGVGTNWANDPEFGDVFAFSPPVEVGAPG